MIETASDRAIFVKDFGQDVSILRANRGRIVVKAIFDNEYEGIVGESVEFATSQPRLTCISEDVDGIAYGDDVTIGLNQYKAVLIMPNGTGITEIMLELQ